MLYNALRPPASRVTMLPEASSPKGLRLGMLSGYLFDRLDEDVEKSVLARHRGAARLGATITEVTLPHAADIATVYLHLVFGDAAAYHARTLESRPQDYTPQRAAASRDGPLRAGRRLHPRAARQGDPRARGRSRARRRRRARLPGVVDSRAAIGAATVPVKGGADAVRTLMLRCTQPFNLSGHPAIALPCGTTPQGLPVGLQLVGHKGRTPALVQAALAVERVIAES